jgi:DNA repair protein RadC
MVETAAQNDNPNAGHRERLRKRFDENGLQSFQDYEVLELLLLYVARQKDMKPIAKKLIEKFGSFQAVLDAPSEELGKVDGVGEAAITLIHFVKQSAARYLEQCSRLLIKPENLTELIDSCRLQMGALPQEQFRLICLNAKFSMVGEDVIADGTIDQAAVYPRKMVEIALKRGATTLIFVHNHPGGDCTPSKQDKLITRGLILAARTVGMTVYDHLIVSQKGFFSFRENGLI